MYFSLPLVTFFPFPAVATIVGALSPQSLQDSKGKEDVLLLSTDAGKLEDGMFCPLLFDWIWVSKERIEVCSVMASQILYSVHLQNAPNVSISPTNSHVWHWSSKLNQLTVSANWNREKPPLCHRTTWWFPPRRRRQLQHHWHFF